MLLSKLGIQNIIYIVQTQPWMINIFQSINNVTQFLYKSSDTSKTLSSHISLFSSYYDSNRCVHHPFLLDSTLQIKVICVNSTSPHSMHQMIHSACLNVLNMQGPSQAASILAHAHPQKMFLVTMHTVHASDFCSII